MYIFSVPGAAMGSIEFYSKLLLVSLLMIMPSIGCIQQTSTQANDAANPFAPPAAPSANVVKPSGVNTSSLNDTSVLGHPSCRGALVGTLWSNVEPQPGVFNFAAIDSKIAAVKAQGKRWSLAVAAGGTGSPLWLTDAFSVPYILYAFKGAPGYRLPLFWDDTAQTRLSNLGYHLAEHYADDDSLMLVYIPQMTANGNEGHLQGVDMDLLIAAGYTDDKWVDAGKRVAKNYARCFANKALAYEVHDINGGSIVPERIITDLWNDTSLNHRVGAAIWWLSGRWDYQSDLLTVLSNFPGDKYAQMIGRSDQTNEATNRFRNGYPAAFTQAQQLGIRYIEPWEWEFKLTGGALREWDAVMAGYNSWADGLP